jgi:molybdenum cofactor biosynthesis protein B
MPSFIPLNIAVVTVSDTRTVDTDKSGVVLVERLLNAGHKLHGKTIVKDDVCQLRMEVSSLITDSAELFRQLSYQEIGSSTIQSRAFAGLVNGAIVFCVPGSPGACATAWDKIISEQLDSTHKPCNFTDKLRQN